MDAEVERIARKPHARGSEQRQRQKRVVTRMTWQEHEQFAANAAKAGLTIPSYIREVGISERATKSRVRRTVDAEASMQLIAALNRAGNNVNQVIKSWHRGGSRCWKSTGMRSPPSMRQSPPCCPSMRGGRSDYQWRQPQRVETLCGASRQRKRQ